MDHPSPLFDAIREAYSLKPGGSPRKVSERVWQLPVEGGAMAVKLYADEQHARADKESAVLEHLRTKADPRLRVQALCHTSGGERMWSGQGAHAMLTRWEAGHFRSYDTFAPAEWNALGASLAALHLSLDSMRLPAPDTIRARLMAIDADEVRSRLLEVLGHALPKGDGAGLRAYIDTCLRMLDEHYPGSVENFPADDPQHPIHNDYNQFNYLFDGTLPPIIVDWEATIGAPREFELVRCLNHLPLEAPALAEVFVRAYQQVRPLRPEHMAWAVDAACLQHALKRWVLQGWLADPPRFASHLHGAMKMVSTMAGSRRHLVDFFSRCMKPAT
jgi:Ser/Thr protein kinase RdoA (MazF antagonist)